jgi:hypothetical protein
MPPLIIETGLHVPTVKQFEFKIVFAFAFVWHKFCVTQTEDIDPLFKIKELPDRHVLAFIEKPLIEPELHMQTFEKHAEFEHKFDPKKQFTPVITPVEL